MSLFNSTMLSFYFNHSWVCFVCFFFFPSITCLLPVLMVSYSRCIFHMIINALFLIVYVVCSFNYWYKLVYFFYNFALISHNCCTICNQFLHVSPHGVVYGYQIEQLLSYGSLFCCQFVYIKQQLRVTISFPSFWVVDQYGRLVCLNNVCSIGEILV